MPSQGFKVASFDKLKPRSRLVGGRFCGRTFRRPCAPSLASRSHEQPVRYPCVKPVGFPNHLLSPSHPAPSLSGPVTSGEGRLQVHFAQWGESVGGTKSPHWLPQEGCNAEVRSREASD